MAINLPLNNIGIVDNSIIGTINSNNTAITTAFQDALARDGTAPNQMLVNLDMNSNQILNLPVPGSLESPIRLIDGLTSLKVTNAATGVTGHVVPYLDGNNTWSGVNTFTQNFYFKSGDPWFDVKAYGAIGDGVTNDTTACQNAIQAALTGGFGVVYFPPGVYYVPGGLTVDSNTHGGLGVTLRGAGIAATYLVCNSVDVTVLTLNNSSSVVEDMAIWGKGVNNDTGSFGSSNPAVYVYNSGAHILRNLSILGGYYCLKVVDTSDCVFENITCYQSYGPGIFYSGGTLSVPSSGDTVAGNWYYRCKFDQNYLVYGAGSPAAATLPLGNWVANSATDSLGNTIKIGTIVYNAGYYWVCSNTTSDGKTGGSFPAFKNYGISMVDNHVTWLFASLAAFSAAVLDSQSNENSFIHCDFTGGFTYGVNFIDSLSSGGPYYTTFTSCVFGGVTDSCLHAAAGSRLSISNSHLGGVGLTGGSGIAFTGSWAGSVTVSNSIIGGATYGIYVGAGNGTVISNNVIGSCATGVLITNVTNFCVSGNSFGTAGNLGACTTGVNISQTTAVVIDHFNVVYNVVGGCTTGVSNTATGTHMTVTGNV